MKAKKKQVKKKSFFETGVFKKSTKKKAVKKCKDKKTKPVKKLKFNFGSKIEIRKLPKFKLDKRKAMIILPNEFKKIKYDLIPPFAKVELIKEKNEITYNLIEPELTKKEQDDYERIIDGLMEVIDLELTSIKNKENVLTYVEKQIQDVVNELNISLTDISHGKIMYFIYRDFIGLNHIEPLLQDPYIEDISCDGLNIPLYIIHRKFGSIKTNIIYKEESELKEFIVKVAERCGRFISYAEPLLDGSLPDGSRVQASYSKDITTHGPTFTIRKFTETPFSPMDLIINKTIGSEVLAFLWLAVESGSSILIAGGTGTGKTTFLNVLSMFIPQNAKIITVEDTRELQLPHENWIPAVTRPGFSKEYGEVTMFDLLKESFRQSPDYVIVGEVRGKEAYVMFQGMASGMSSMGTMHAGKVEDVINRLQTEPINLSPSFIETLDLVLIMSHTRGKGQSARRLKEVVEIESIDFKTGASRTNRIYTWLPSTDTFEKRGYSWLLQKISKNKGIALEELQQEVLDRKKVLDWMRKSKISDYKEVANLIKEYRQDKVKFMKRIGVVESVKKPVVNIVPIKKAETIEPIKKPTAKIVPINKSVTVIPINRPVKIVPINKPVTVVQTKKTEAGVLIKKPVSRDRSVKKLIIKEPLDK
ncbi:MAG: type II/IV secretion system ATPase subunit [Nanoarchaeota archaeon]|nr:type II/IV secretion system ATPase subunit [Nanoarchaeota archaeon]